MATIIQRCLCASRRVLRPSVCPFLPCRRHKTTIDNVFADRDFMYHLQKDYEVSLSSVKKYMEDSKAKARKEDQVFRKERYEMLGPDLAAAHFIVPRGGAVKFEGRDAWVRGSTGGKMPFPNRKQPGFNIEGIDMSGVELLYEGMENFIDLHHVRYMNFSNCPFFDDWCLARLHIYSDTLEYLDISNCPNVTERGVATVYKLEKLKGLRMENLVNVQDQEILAVLLEELLPELQVVGAMHQAELRGDNGLASQQSLTETDTDSIAHQPVDRAQLEGRPIDTVQSEKRHVDTAELEETVTNRDRGGS